MTVPEAIRALLEEFHLEEHIDMVRDEAKYDLEFKGLSSEHPRVTRFREAVQALRDSLCTATSTPETLGNVPVDEQRSITWGHYVDASSTGRGRG